MISRIVATIGVVVSFFVSDALAFSPTKIDKSIGIIGDIHLTFQGGFRLPVKKNGVSRLAYSKGPIAIDSDGKSMFIVGHTKHQAIAQVEIPPLKNSQDLGGWQVAEIIQSFSPLLKKNKRIVNKQNVNTVTGLEVVGNQIVVNGVEYYDANTNVTDTTLVIQNKLNLLNSPIHGFKQLQGAAHVAGWMTPIYGKWRHLLGRDYIFGHANNQPIVNRHSIGPSAFLVNMADVVSPALSQNVIPTKAVLDYSMRNPLHSDRHNETRKNRVWTEVSEAIYSFMIPKSDHYLVIGNSGGYESGLGYKIKDKKREKGKKRRHCGGSCTVDPLDNYHTVWIYDAADMYSSLEGELLPHDLYPIEHKKVHFPFEYIDGSFRSIVGVDYFHPSQLLFVMLSAVDGSQNRYERAPVVLVYRLNV